MKQVFQNSEVAHIWARQSQSEGRNSANNIYFRNKDIFSYGSHFCMGRIIDSSTVILTNRRYSNTTAKHLRDTFRAVSHYTNQISMPYPADNLQGNAQHLINEIKGHLADLNNKRKKEETRERAANNLRSIVDNVERYLIATDQKLTKRWIDTNLQKEFNLYYTAAKELQASDETAAKVEKLNKAKERAQTKARKERERECLEAVPNWLNGARSYVVINRMRELQEIYLRRIDITADENYGEATESIVETSHGARVSLSAAKILYLMIKQGRDIKGHDIDGYTVVSINGVLTIGCHKIATAEVERFAKSQGW